MNERIAHTLLRDVLPVLTAALVLTPSARAASPEGQWPQFGGPNRDFVVHQDQAIADKWPEGGPKQLWKRSLGDGYATIAVDGDRLYTMYRNTDDKNKPGPEEHVVCLDAKDGKTLWESSYEAPGQEQQDDSFGWGPNPTPLIVGDRLFTAGFTAKMHCLDKNSGSVIWSHDLAAEYGCKPDRFGYSISPTPYGETVIMLVGGEGGTVVAFNQSDGSLAWKSQEYKISHCSPLLINFHGQDQLVCLVEEKAIALNPADGSLLWEHNMEKASNISTPVWGDGDVLFCSSAYESGSRAVKLVADGGSIKPEELWYTRKVRIHFGNAIRIGDYVYASSGQDGPAFVSCVNVKTGNIEWRKRGIAKATCIYADGKLILMAEDGQLLLTRVSPEELEILSECKISDTRCWSAPTLVGTTMYVRDRKDIMAFDIG